MKKLLVIVVAFIAMSAFVGCGNATSTETCVNDSDSVAVDTLDSVQVDTVDSVVVE